MKLTMSDDEVDSDIDLQVQWFASKYVQRKTHVQFANDPATYNEYEFSLDSNWEIPRQQMKLGPSLGEGAFGRVFTAELRPEALGLLSRAHNGNDCQSNGCHPNRCEIDSTVVRAMCKFDNKSQPVLREWQFYFYFSRGWLYGILLCCGKSWRLANSNRIHKSIVLKNYTWSWIMVIEWIDHFFFPFTPCSGAWGAL